MTKRCCVVLLVTVTLYSNVSAQPLEPISGYDFMTAEEQALQDDEFANPGLLWVDEGQRLFAEPPVPGAESCQDCHGGELADVATRYPTYSRDLDRVASLAQQVNVCRTQRQGLNETEYESPTLLALTAYLGFQARGKPIAPSITERTKAAVEAGRDYYYQRRGQLNLACAHCHEDNIGKMLRGDRLSQGQATGYPAYKLEWQGIGSLHRRLRDCDIGVRAEPFATGSPTYVNLELYLKTRASGLSVETPAVRR